MSAPAISASGAAAPAKDRDADRRVRHGWSADHPRRSAILTVLMLCGLLYFLLPLWWLVVASTKSNADLFTSFGLWFADHDSFVENVRTVFTIYDGVFALWLRNTIVYSVVSAVGAAFLATAAGYAFAKYRFPGRNAIFSGILGAIIYMVARDQFSGINPQYWYFWIGLLLVAVVMFLPNGILGGLSALYKKPR